MLHRPLHLIAHARYAARQARRGALRASDARSQMCALRPARAARGVQATAAIGGDVRALSARGVHEIGIVGEEDETDYKASASIEAIEDEVLVRSFSFTISPFATGFSRRYCRNRRMSYSSTLGDLRFASNSQRKAAINC